jgi:hypothetical protein
MLLHSAVAALLQATSDRTNYFTPSPLGILLAWWICNRNKRNPIGGWLMFYYWQVYGGILVTLLFFALSAQSYVPENFDSTRRFALFLASALPGLILLFIEAAVATFLLSARTWDMVKLLRCVMMALIAVTLLGTVIDGLYFPESLAFGFLGLGSTTIWLAYFFRSKRIQHVFWAHDWDAAVGKIYPSKPTSLGLIT